DERLLIGHLKYDEHAALLLQVDPVRGLLFAGGIDYGTTPAKPVIDVWDVSRVNVAPGTAYEPQPSLSIHTPWEANHLGLDQSGTGLLYTWDEERGPVAVPFESPRFVFSGLYRPGEDEAESPDPGERPNAIQKITSRLVPLGVPMATTLEAEDDEREENERKGTAAFKVRIALPGSFGEE
ncbi:MAG: hypothetical protein GY856_54870, partial [bacterium]|nr:hypothetical protein [bacterium]